MYFFNTDAKASEVERLERELAREKRKRLEWQNKALAEAESRRLAVQQMDQLEWSQFVDRVGGPNDAAGHGKRRSGKRGSPGKQRGGKGRSERTSNLGKPKFAKTETQQRYK